MTERPVSLWLCPETIGREGRPDLDYTFSSFFFLPVLHLSFAPCITWKHNLSFMALDVWELPAIPLATQTLLCLFEPCTWPGEIR